MKGFATGRMWQLRSRNIEIAYAIVKLLKWCWPFLLVHSMSVSSLSVSLLQIRCSIVTSWWKSWLVCIFLLSKGCLYEEKKMKAAATFWPFRHWVRRIMMHLVSGWNEKVTYTSYWKLFPKISFQKTLVGGVTPPTFLPYHFSVACSVPVNCIFKVFRGTILSVYTDWIVTLILRRQLFSTHKIWFPFVFSICFSGYYCAFGHVDCGANKVSILQFLSILNLETDKLAWAMLIANSCLAK